jgi:hypothetical protein
MNGLILLQLFDSVMLTPRTLGKTVTSGNVSTKNCNGSPFNFVFSANTVNL